MPISASEGHGGVDGGVAGGVEGGKGEGLAGKGGGFEVGWYACGPTVYDDAVSGLSFVFFAVLGGLGLRGGLVIGCGEFARIGVRR